MKRTLIIILIALLTLLAGYILFTKNEVVFSKETSLYKAVPLSSPVFFEISSLKSIPQKNELLNDLSGIELIYTLLANVSKSDSIISELKEVQSSWAKRPFILAYDFVGDYKIEPLIISTIKNKNELHGFEILLSEISGVSDPELNEKKYSSYKVFSFSKPDGKRLYFSAAEGLILFSTELILVEKGLRQLSSENITDIRNFNTVYKTAGSGTLVASYINHERFAELLARAMNGRTSTKENEFGETERINLRSSIIDTKNFASWSELDMSLNDEMISMNGITAADDSLNQFITVFNGQTAERCNAGKILPRNTSFYIGYSFSDRNLFFEKLMDYFKMSSSFYEREEYLKKMERSFGKDSRETFKEMVNKEVIAAITNVSAEGEISSLFLVSLSAKKTSQENFEKMMLNHANSKKTELNSMISPVPAANGKTFRVYEFPFPSLPGVWLGEPFRFAKARYAAFYDDYLVFASSQKVMQEYLADMELAYSLDNDRSYSNFIKASDSKANISTFINISRLLPLKSSLLHTEAAKKTEGYAETLQKVSLVNWQMICEKDIFFNSIHLGKPKQTKNDGLALWTCNLGANLAMKPQVVENHNNPSQKDIVVQDEDNRLHLISANGQIRWTIPITGRILGEIHQVDHLRNGKWQFLFNTREKLYMIDINGNNVAGFPVSFDSPATNGVSVFDYDNNHKYRYFLAFENRKVVVFDQNGKAVSGWNFDKTESAVTTPIHHFRVNNNKDYIVFKDAGKIYIQDRRGETRVKTPVQFENSDNPIALNLNGTPKMVATDKNGKVYYLYFDGKYDEKNVGTFSAGHLFAVDDLDGNNILDFIFTDGKKLTVMDENGKNLFDETLDNELTLPPSVYGITAKQKMVGVTDSKGNRIYLFEPGGKSYNGFPIAGNSQFCIGSITPGQLSVVVGNDNGELVCYAVK